MTWPLNGSEAEGDLVLVQTSLLLSNIYEIIHICTAVVDESEE